MKRSVLTICCILIISFNPDLAFSTGFNKNSLTVSAGKDTVNPVDVFEQVWSLLDANYPFFDEQGIDWKAIYKVYKPKITEASSEDELFTVLCNMLEIFNSGHINLETGTKRFCSLTRTNSKMEDFSWKLVKEKYLNNRFKSSPDSLFYYGWVNAELAYLRIRRFPNKEILEKYIDNIIGELSGAKGLVLDIRGNPGGNAFGVAALGSRFADRKRLYMKIMNRTGGDKKEFINPTYYYIEPMGPIQYKGPVILLQNVYSESGSDDFALAMRVLPNVTSVGESTGGCFSSFYPEKLINGWTLSMPWSYAVDQNGFCWEGIGVPPDLRKANSKENITAGNDKVLEFGMDILKAGGHFGKEVGGSLNDIRVSLVDQFIVTSALKGIQNAVKEFEDSQSKPDGCYFSIQELNIKVRGLLQSEKNEEALFLLQKGVKAFPEEPGTIYFLARMYENYKKQPEKAKPLWEKLASMKPAFPWERNLIAEAQKSLEKADSSSYLK